ncbi:ABC transporter substrate-binding protein [Jiella sp. MQZ9-1]|uniref:ABC transporter substrate-binding protein n=1 Tax=Jiella flava TaxID=2816857 RepID=A0A939JT94_9HYPH|nr:ABC transporter substrate-binding protein [Jiella flava]MBO0661895.1 ABC transporter substrate-binding protein [Jiella flava]MCD2470777.1 ABC transporter substrate-binding protein [Jiella flava]
MRAIVLGLFLSLAGIGAARAEPIVIHDDSGHDVTLASPPQRIASLYDVDVTIPLIELGVMPIASHGRLDRHGNPYMRSSALLTGVDFDNSDIAFIGATDIDLEALAALKPDLIITALSRPTPIEQLRKIAPTIVINADLGAPHIYRLLAAATGREQQLKRLERRYGEQIALLKTQLHPQDYSVSVFQPLRGKLDVYHSYRAIGQVLRDAGFRFPKLIDSVPEGQSRVVSAEYLPDLDADVIFDPYRADRPGGAKAEIRAMEKMVPGFCRFLSACRAGHYLLIPRDEAISNSYAALFDMVTTIRTAFERPASDRTQNKRSNSLN